MLLRKLCIGIIVSFFTVEPLVSIPLQFLIIFVSICMQLRWGPYISVKNRCGVCGSGLFRKVSVRCCRGANNRIELILMSAESLLLVAGFANAAVGGTGSSINGGAGTNNQTINKRSRARLATINGTNPTNSSSFSYSPSSMPPTYSVTTVIVQHSVIPVFEWLGSLLFLVGIWLGNACFFVSFLFFVVAAVACYLENLKTITYQPLTPLVLFFSLDVSFFFFPFLFFSCSSV